MHITHDGLHAFEHLLVNVLPLHVLIDRRDVGSTTQYDSGGGRVTLFDRCEGGAGLCERTYQKGLLESLLDEAAQLVRGCPCSDGCPSCVHLSGCGKGNDRLDKRDALALLEGRPLGPAESERRIRDVDEDQQRRRVKLPNLEPIEVGRRVSTSNGSAIVLEVQDERVRVQYDGLSSWTWLQRKEINP
jgi:DEAD/DEAH box helicase domain-containing protein